MVLNRARVVVDNVKYSSGNFLEGQSNKWENQRGNCTSKAGRHYQMRTSETAWTSFTNGSPQTSARSSHMGTRGFQEEARSTATELETCRQERSRENGHQLGRGWRGCGGQEELEESCRPMRLWRGMNQEPERIPPSRLLIPENCYNDTNTG